MNNFRNHQKLDLTLKQSPVIIVGNNGSGKTNILEALSLLSPGKGLRSAHANEIGYYGATDWALNVDTHTGDEPHNIGVGYINKKKLIKIDHKPQPSQIELTTIARLIWLTPQMNTLFIGNRKNRLNFFDRIVFSFNAEHARNILIYERSKQERAELLRKQILNNDWLSILEMKMAEAGTKIAGTRLEVIQHLQERIYQNKLDYFKITIKGKVEQLIQSETQHKQEFFAQTLKELRDTDMLSKRTNYGAHTSNFDALHTRKNIPAQSCSTGEQKLIMIAIILAAIRADTILLLDDITANLDCHNRSALFSAILEENCQAWITDTHTHRFNEIRNQSQTFVLDS